MKRGRVWEFDSLGMSKMEKDFWTDVFRKHEPLNLKAISEATGLRKSTISKKITGVCSLTVPQYETLKKYFDELESEWGK